MIREAIELLVRGQSLSTEQARQAMNEIMEGEATPAQFGAFVTALRIKGETPDEITGMALVMREKSLHVNVDGPLVDTCGTGGDASGTFNISTTAAFVVAGAGVKVAKHGNRAMSGATGSADVLESLGVKIDLSPGGVERCLNEVGIGFMFAQTFHPSMRFAAGPRREIGIPTVFNILGPLTNPAGASSQVLGVADASVAEKMARVLANLGAGHALVVHGEDGLDEISLSGATKVWQVKGGSVSSFTTTPEEFGLHRVPKGDLQAASVEDSKRILIDVLQGKTGPTRDIVIMNAGAALLAADAADSLKHGIELAAQSIDSGKAHEKLSAFVELSQKLK